jgi:hypothetical protein
MIRTVTSAITETVTAVDGETIFVTQTGSITGVFDGIVSGFLGVQTVAARIAGDIETGFVGVAFNNFDPEVPVGSVADVHLLKTGSITTDSFGTGIGFSFFETATISVDGTIDADTGIRGDTGRITDIRLTGRVTSEVTGLDLTGMTGSATNVRNAGTIDVTGSFGTAVNFFGPGTFSLINTFDILGDVRINTADDTRIVNSGQIVGDTTGVDVGNGPVVLINAAGISGDDGVRISSSGTMKVINQETGQISGQSHGLDVSFSSGVIKNAGSIEGGFEGVSIDSGAVRLMNTGSISGGNGVTVSAFGEKVVVKNAGRIETTSLSGDSISVFGGTMMLENTGKIFGHLDASSADKVGIENAGRIVGSVNLGFGNDTFSSGPTGFVTGAVFGGSGKDTLIGGEFADQLFGEFESDHLVGNGGRDVLNGGSGNDSLTGGAGRDRFVFDIGFGSDRITDFEQGRDIIEMRSSSFAFLQIRDKGADLLIRSGGDRIFLEGQAGTTLTEADFDFV